MFTNKHDAFLIRFSGKNYPVSVFYFEIFVLGKDLWGHVDVANLLPTDTEKMKLMKTMKMCLKCRLLFTIPCFREPDEKKVEMEGERGRK